MSTKKNIDKEVQEWAKRLKDRLHAELKKRKLVASEELLNSLSTKYTSKLNGTINQVEIAFAEQGKFNDFTRITRGQIPPINQMEAWLEESNKINIPYHQKGHAYARNKLAWRISIAKYQKEDGSKRNRRSWFRKHLYTYLYGLLYDLIDRYEAKLSTGIWTNF